MDATLAMPGDMIPLSVVAETCSVVSPPNMVAEVCLVVMSPNLVGISSSVVVEVCSFVSQVSFSIATRHIKSGGTKLVTL